MSTPTNLPRHTPQGRIISIPSDLPPRPTKPSRVKNVFGNRKVKIYIGIFLAVGLAISLTVFAFSFGFRVHSMHGVSQKQDNSNKSHSSALNMALTSTIHSTLTVFETKEEVVIVSRTDTFNLIVAITPVLGPAKRTAEATASA